MTPLLDDLNERLLTHFVGGAWRAPFSTKLVPLRSPAGALGQMVLACDRDLARAKALHRRVPERDWARLTHAAQSHAVPLAAELARLGFPCDPSMLRDIPVVLREVPCDWHPSTLALLHAIAIARLAQRLSLRQGSVTVLARGLR